MYTFCFSGIHTFNRFGQVNVTTMIIPWMIMPWMSCRSPVFIFTATSRLSEPTAATRADRGVWHDVAKSPRDCVKFVMGTTGRYHAATRADVGGVAVEATVFHGGREGGLSVLLAGQSIDLCGP